MKAGIFSDAHIPPLGDPRFPDYIGTLERIVQGMVDREVDLVLFGGDVSTVRHGKPQVQVVEAFGRALRPLRDSDIEVRAIVGNHDLPRGSREANALDCLDMAWDHRKSIYLSVFSSPRWLPAYNIIYLPYPNRNLLLSQEEYKTLTVEEANRVIHDLLVVTLQDLASRLDPNVPSILLAHVGLSQARVGSENQFMFGNDICLSVADIPGNIDWCFFGHVHKPQEINAPAVLGLPNLRDPCAPIRVESQIDVLPKGKVYVIGSIECVNFGEEGEQKRWLLLDTDKGTVESVPTGAREYRTFRMDICNPESEGDNIYVGPGDPGTLGAIVRVKLKMNRGQRYDFARLKRDLLDAGAFSVQIEPEYVDDSRLVLADSPQGETHEDILRAYCVQKGIAGEEADTLVADGLGALEGVSDEITA